MTAVDSQNNQIFLSILTEHWKEPSDRSFVRPSNLFYLSHDGNQSVSVTAIAMENGLQTRLYKRPLSELACDNALGWLIQVGVLRREVDGQGITDGFRLTPLGRQLAEKFHGKNWRTPSLRDRLFDAVIRWLRIPF